MDKERNPLHRPSLENIIANSFFERLSGLGYSPYHVHFNVETEKRYEDGVETTVTQTSVKFSPLEEMEIVPRGTFVVLESPDAQNAYLLSFDLTQDFENDPTEYVIGLSSVPHHSATSNLIEWMKLLSQTEMTAYNYQPDNSLYARVCENKIIKLSLKSEDKILTNFYNSLGGNK